jgi:hypothetical protein
VWTSELPLHVAEMTLRLDEPDAFERWLIERLAQARAERAETRMRARRAGPRRAS